MRIIYMGTPDFAVPALDALAAAGHDIVAVYSQPPRPAGRGKGVRPSPVHARAQEMGVEVRTPVSLKGAEEQAAFAALDADIAVVAAYGLILPRPVLDAPRHGCLNIHASLLPRWRGAAPIHRAIEAGDAQTGITIMRMEAGLDTGPMLLSAAIDIDAQDTTGSLHDKLAELGGKLVVEALEGFDQLPAVSQPEAGVTYASKIDKLEAKLDWSQPAATLARRVRAFNPFPGAVVTLAGEPVKVWRGDVVVARGRPGQVLAADGAGIVVACAEDALRLTELQKPGGRRVASADFLHGNPLRPD